MLSRRRGVLFVTGALLLIAPPVTWILTSFHSAAREMLLPKERSVARAAGPATLAALAEQDPMALVRMGRERYTNEITHYRCVLTKQERLGDELTAVQRIEIRYREKPHTVYMIWQENADQAKRALYMDDAQFVDKKGQKLARVEPAGAIARLFVKDLFVQIHGPEAQKSSRRAIDECGFKSTFDLLERFNAIAAERGVLDLHYGGTGEVDGRPTYVITRNLPYEGPAGAYPDARMVLHLDQQWLLPVAVYSYADRTEKQLLGSYVFTQVELNPAFGTDAFQF